MSDKQIRIKMKKTFESESAWRLTERQHSFWLSHEKREIVKMLPKRVHIALDVGAGRGRFSSELGKRSDETVALDISSEMLKDVKEKVAKMESSSVDCVLGSGRLLPFPSKSVDLIIAVQIIGHLIDVPDFLKEVSRTLRAKGILILSTGNSFSLHNLKNLLRWRRKNRRFWLLDQGHCRDSYFFLRRTLRQLGFSVNSVSGAGLLKLQFLEKLENLSSVFPFKYFSSLIILSCRKL